MLRFISIDNYTLIDHLEAEFRPGLNLITGETGSGKSILVDAVGLLVGSRASQEMVREGRDLARIEGIFSIPGAHPVREALQSANLGNGEEEDLIIRREISLTGSNRVFVNGRLSTLNQLLEIGPFLVNIHGQHEQQGLLQATHHLEFLDAFGRNHPMVEEVARSYHRLIQLGQRIAEIEASERDRLQRRDLLQYQIREIEQLKLEAGLDRSLEEEKSLLSSAERRAQTVRETYDLLYEREDSVLSMIDRISQRISDLAELDPSILESSQRVEEIYYQLEEIAFQTRDYAEKIEFDPVRLEQVLERLAEIAKAKRKYGATIEEILAYLEGIGREARDLELQETELEHLSSEEVQVRASYQQAAKKLSAKRSGDAVRLAELLERELAQLAMGETRFKVELQQNEAKVEEKGIDSVEFLISPNPGEPLKPLAKIASGGELSRIMLALKSILRGEEFPRTLVFDEIDAGIGGRVATSLGEKLFALSNRHQVFCVTHLPQIAALAEQHFHVGKWTKGERTVVDLVSLDERGRVEELSRMLAGDAATDTTRRQARELMKPAAGKEISPA